MQPEGLVGWWRGNGTTADDSPAGVAGSWVGPPAYASGVVGLGFDESAGGYVQVPDHPSIDLTSGMSIIAWVETAAWSGRIVDKIQAGGMNGYLLDTYGGRLRLIVGSGWQWADDALPPPGAFVHIAGTYASGTSPMAHLYVDGKEVSSSVMFTLSTAIPTNSLPLRIGADQSGASLFGGILNEVLIFDRPLSGAEVQALFAAGASGVCRM
jgi:hypothetical protein